MSPISEQITEMVDMLPENEQNLAFELIKRLVLAWDPDYTKVTPVEAVEIDRALAEHRRGDMISLEDIRPKA
jgi:hypothetical protein